MKLPLVLTSAALAGCTTMPDPCKPTLVIPTITSLAIAGAMLAGCSVLPSSNSEAVSALAVDKEVQPMSRQEVIHGINECEKAGMRPVVLTTKRKVNNQMIPAVVEITCLPGFK
jgi:hypothetical protein